MKVGVINEPKVSFFETFDRLSIENPTLLSNSFKSGVTIPSPDWKSINIETVNDVVELNGRNLIVAKLGNSIIDRAHEAITLLLKKDPNYSTLQSKINNTLKSFLSNSIKAEIEKTVPVSVDLDSSIVAVNYYHLYPEASLIEKSSTTHDPKTECGLRGLHVDNWNEPPLLPRHRQKASYKLLYNLGVEDRNFVFSRMPVDILAQQSESIASHSKQYLDFVNAAYFASPLIESYLHSSAEIQFARISYEPGSCLIAPVQNLIHDGYLYNLTTADICLQSRTHQLVN